MNLLHNMSAPPRSTIVVAPGIHRPRMIVLAAHDWLPHDGSGFLARLCEAAGLGVPADPMTRLVDVTAELLVGIDAPAAAVLQIGGDARPCSDRLLTLAILSRASDRLFLRARTPRFDHTSLARTVSIPTVTFPLENR